MSVASEHERILVHPTTINLEEARHRLQGEEYGLLSPKRVFRGMVPDRLAGMDQIYVPHWYFQMSAQMEDAVQQYHAHGFWLAVDAIQGTMWQTNQQPPLQEISCSAVAPALVLQPIVSREQAEQSALESLRWEVLFRGRLRARLVERRLLGAYLVHVPFWVGYFVGAGGQLRARILHGLEKRILDERATHRYLKEMENYLRGV